jgi:hypothetical protein
MKRMTLALLAGVLLLGCATAQHEKEEQSVVFYPAPPLQPRLQFLHSISVEKDIGKSRSMMQEFLLGKPDREKAIGKPYDIGSSKGKIYVMDRSMNKLLIINLETKSFDYLRDQRLGELEDPSGIWITADDVKYIADMKRKQVVVFGPDNRYVRAYGGSDLFDRPTDVAVFDDRLYVCDMNKNQVFVLDKTSGRLMMTIGQLGTDTAQFYKPTHVYVDASGYLYVNDAFNFRVQKFAPDGSFIKSFGSLGDTLGSFARPKGLTVDKAAHLYVADAAFENVQIFDAESGRLLLFMGGPGQKPGSMYLPSGVHIDYENVAYFKQFADKDFKVKYLLYVGNTFGDNKLNVYGFGDWTGPPLSAPIKPETEDADVASQNN